MMSEAKVISMEESNPSVAVTSVVSSSLYKGKLVSLIKQAKIETVRAIFYMHRKKANLMQPLNQH